MKLITRGRGGDKGARETEKAVTTNLLCFNCPCSTQCALLSWGRSGNAQAGRRHQKNHWQPHHRSIDRYPAERYESQSFQESFHYSYGTCTGTGRVLVHWIYCNTDLYICICTYNYSMYVALLVTRTVLVRVPYIPVQVLGLYHSISNIPGV